MPISTATRLSLSGNASAKPITVCSPRKGKNPNPTPSENAAAVRSGESWIWSSFSSHPINARLVKWYMALEVGESAGQGRLPGLALEPDSRFLRQSPDLRHGDVRHRPDCRVEPSSF